ncbi:uncharacterized protein ACNLHF_011808 [Anomaloglossus baeobatrachus]
MPAGCQLDAQKKAEQVWSASRPSSPHEDGVQERRHDFRLIFTVGRFLLHWDTTQPSGSLKASVDTECSFVPSVMLYTDSLPDYISIRVNNRPLFHTKLVEKLSFAALGAHIV